MKKLLPLLVLAVLAWSEAQVWADQSVTASPQYVQSVVAPGQQIEVVIRFKAGAMPATARTPPLSLALVIDRSGSMDEAGKLSYAKLAARDLTDRLSHRDQLALISYSSEVRTDLVLTKTSPENKRRFIDSIDKLYASGATNLSGGLEAGFAQLRRADTADNLRRVILLSDGLANNGETRPSRIAALAVTARQQGISLSTMGMGADYDEDLMQLLAQRGGGHYYYIRQAEDSSLFFNRELKEIMGGVSRDIRLKLILNPEIGECKIYGYTVNQEAGEYQIDLSDFYGGEERSMIIEFTPKASASGSLPLGSLELTYQDLTQEGQNIRQQIPLAVTISSDEQAQKSSHSQEAMVEIITMRADQKYSQAIEAADSGRFVEAKQLVEEAEAYLAAEDATQNTERLSAQRSLMRVQAAQLAAMSAASKQAQQEYIKSAKSSLYNTGKGNLNSQLMKEGSKGLEVELLQAELNRRGYYKGQVNGIYGDDLKEAVRQFQTDNGLNADGIAGPETQAALGL
jgi:Ca-activated chloride channel family protein